LFDIDQIQNIDENVLKFFVVIKDSFFYDLNNIEESVARGLHDLCILIFEAFEDWV